MSRASIKSHFTNWREWELNPIVIKELRQAVRSWAVTGMLLLFLTVLPGIFEELTFRGMLLHGLHRRLRPALLVLVVGVVFGIYHVALFRFVPTACLGVMFAAVTLLTGSIYPAMLWHALNNALGVLAYKLQVPEAGLDPVCYFAAGGMLAAAFWIFWRNRTPYPGLK